MNERNLIFLNILSCALKGETARDLERLSEQDWQELIRLAQIHKVLPLVYEAAHRQMPQARQVKVQVRRQVLLQTLKTEAFFRLNRHLQEAGVKPLVVKGIVCRSLYPKPELRPSSDEDLLIAPEEFERCQAAMAAFPMTPQGGEDAYEIPYRQEGSPLYIELHRQLFPPESQAYGDWNRFFADVHTRPVCQEIQGAQVYTLPPTDHMFYLICHAFKHFLHSGFGIRQVCDIVMYANTWGAQIDWDQVLENCCQIRAEVFAATLLYIGEAYLNLDPENGGCGERWLALRTEEGPMLEDLLSAGVFGSASADRLHSAGMTLDAVAADKRGKTGRASLKGSLFPSAKRLEGRYPYLKDRPWLLPLAWGQRLVKYGKERGSGVETVRIGKERVELLRKYGVIK